MTRNPLWDEIDNSLLGHWLAVDQQTGKINLNRVAGKCVLASLEPETCSVHQETIAFDDLKRLKLFDKPNQLPNREFEPIIVLEIEGVRYVVDGRRRVTKWINDGIDKPRAAIIIVPKQWRKWPHVWTAEKPAQTGWYWYRASPDAPPHPVKIFDANLLYVWPVNDRVAEKENVTMRLSDCSGEFAGPLEPPA